MNVNAKSFRNFMDPKTYKNQRSAFGNSAYWAAAKLFEQVKFEKDSAPPEEKRKAKNKKNFNDDGPAKKKKSSEREEAVQLIERITAVEGVSEDIVHDSCPQIVQKIKEFLEREGMTKKLLLEAFGGINSNSLLKFMNAKKQDQCANVTYREAWVFFEKLRILEEKPKTAARLKNEGLFPNGFPLVKQGRCIARSLFGPPTGESFEEFMAKCNAYRNRK